MKPTRQHHARLRLGQVRGGFTLIELLVTISIIALLIGILIPAAFAMLGRAEISRTRSALIAMTAALDEYKLKAGSAPDHTDTSVNNLEVTDDDDDTTMGYFLVRVMQTGGPAEKALRSGAGRELLTKQPTDGAGDIIPDFNTAASSGELQTFLDPEEWEMRDLWDTKLRYAAKVSHRDTFTDDDYLPAHPNPFFASAGPDGEFGDAKILEEINGGDTSGLSDDDIDQARLAEDNIYSFNLE